MFQGFTKVPHEDSTPRTLDLPRDGTVRLPPGRGETVVRAVLGTVVVTREGDAEDHVLTPGAELRLPPAGLAVAWAMAASRIQVWHERRGGAAHGHRLPAAA
ncbi:MAG: DUF2917 domain-containing protein [Anaeromyxobacteraceae bacterium]|nr:DUF2917 domain-containing protein [Anaeromyxobacteraceae bacterium]